MATQMDNVITRVQSIKCYDDQKQQRFEAWGRAHERFGGTTGKNAVPRIQGYGFTSHPPTGSQGVTTTLGGNPDNTMIIGMEHPDYRPKNLAEGEFKVYDKWEAYQHGKQDRWIHKVGNAITLHIRAGGHIHLNPPSIDWTP